MDKPQELADDLERVGNDCHLEFSDDARAIIGRAIEALRNPSVTVASLYGYEAGLAEAARHSTPPARDDLVEAPWTPTEVQWGGLARSIMMWLDIGNHTPRALFKHLERSGVECPDWLREEPEMKHLDHVPSKGTRCVLIYRAMLSALSAPRPAVGEERAVCMFCQGPTTEELALKQRLQATDWVRTKLGDVAEWAYPILSEGVVLTALKKAARTIKQIDADKVWCTSDVNEALGLLKEATALSDRQAGEGWQPIASAPRDGTEFQARIPGNGEDNVIAWQADAFLNSDEKTCGGWAFTRDQEPPDCWTDGICWEVNEDENASVQPTHWKPLTPSTDTGEGAE